eukprot:1973658-Prymnesium_polylepis.1
MPAGQPARCARNTDQWFLREAHMLAPAGATSGWGLGRHPLELPEPARYNYYSATSRSVSHSSTLVLCPFSTPRVGAGIG